MQTTTQRLVAMVGQAWVGILTLTELRQMLTAEEWAMAASLDTRLDVMVAMDYE